jgi:hypothetical protein
VNRLVTEPVPGPLGLAQVLTTADYVASLGNSPLSRWPGRGIEIASSKDMRKKPEKPEKKARRGRAAPEHDPETTSREGMSAEGTAVDEGETMASTGDEEGAFQQIVSGTATGLGLDRGENIGTGGLASDEDRDDVAEGDYLRQFLRSDPFAAPERSAEHIDEEHGRLGWETGADLDPRDQAIEFRNRSADRKRSEPEEH